jgi:hypothetical protein
LQIAVWFPVTLRGIISPSDCRLLCFLGGSFAVWLDHWIEC